MGWKLTNSRERVMSEINITPLTDVMLVLLVIFMVTAPLIMTDSFKIKLPKAVSPDAGAGKGMVVSVSEKGRLSIDGREIKAEDLLPELEKGFRGGADRTVVVRADGNARHSAVVNVLDTAKLAGAVKLSIATEKDVR